MDETLQTHFHNIFSKDKELQNRAYNSLIEATERPVDWAYEVWDEMVKSLGHKDNHVRAITAQVLCGLAKSDPQKRMLKDFDALLAVTRDERFVTARHCMQSLWKVGVVGIDQRKRYVEGLEGRFNECITEKNGTLIRYDILQSFRDVYDQVKDETIREKALALIQTEEDPKYRKKYASVWRAA